MIYNFRKISNNLYRGSAPSIEDVIILDKKFNIKKIVSLDEDAGKRIDRACRLLDINHVMLPIDVGKKLSLIKFLNQDVVELFDHGGPTYVHCIHGKDRTGLACAMYRCEKQNWSCGEALEEAKSFGFGIGVDPRIIKLYIKLIKNACGCSKNDTNHTEFGYDIVSNQREYPSDYADYTLGNWEQQSWSPYEDYRVKAWPGSTQQIDYPEQYSSREDYGLDDTTPDSSMDYGRGFPQPGGWDTSILGINGTGPSLVGSGYI
jgi:hypothetical protein